MRRTRSLVFVILIALGASTALAHIPRASWLMSRMAKQRQKMNLRRMVVELRCGPDAEHMEPAKLYLEVPRRIRWERAAGSVLICNGGRCQLQREGAAAQQLDDWVLLQFLFFVERQTRGERWLRLLRSLKVDTGVDTLTRAGSRLAVVLGAKEWERDRPQFWIDKSRYLPLRLMFEHGRQLMDIRWTEWGGRHTGDWFPGRFEVRADGERQVLCQADHVEVNRSIPDALFELKK